MIDVSCILINYNSSSFTIEAVKSIILNTDERLLSYEIIVIDNASKIEDFEKLNKELSNSKNTRVYRSKINTGFGGGNMLGVQYASECAYYAFINNDTLLTTVNTLCKLKQFMKENEDVGLVSPQMLDQNGNFRVTIDHFCSPAREILKRSTLEKINPKKYLNRKIRYKKPTEVNYVQGFFMFVDKQVFDKIGGFDTNLFLYYEESDLSLRMLKRENKKTFLIPEIEYIHYQGKSIERGIVIKIEQKLSQIYYIKKHFGWFWSKFLIVYYCIRYFFTSIFKPTYWILSEIIFCFFKRSSIKFVFKTKATYSYINKLIISRTNSVVAIKANFTVNDLYFSSFFR